MDFEFLLTNIQDYYRNKIDLIVQNNTKTHRYAMDCHAAQTLSRCEHHVITPAYAAFIPHLNQICSMISKGVMKMLNELLSQLQEQYLLRYKQLPITLRLITTNGKLESVSYI